MALLLRLTSPDPRGSVAAVKMSVGRVMKKATRRTCLKQIALAAAASVLPAISRPLPVFAMAGVFQQPTPTESEAVAMAAIAQQYMKKYNAPGLSVAVARHGQFVYQKGFGYADKAAGEEVTPASLFRIASVTKPVTSTAIFTLIEQGRLGLDDLIFGAPGLLKFDYGKDYPEVVNKITLHHLLTHTCGGWDNSGRDPMFSRPGMDHKELITWAVHNLPLQYAPGTHYAYSNFGYCILGRVIEKITGQSYAEFVQQTVLAKCGLNDMRLAGNTLAQRAAGEVVYYGQAGSGPNPYGMNVTRMDSHGGWIARPSDLVQFAMHVDGFKTTPNILGANTIQTMTTASAANPHYACGWNVNNVPNWWHSGSLPGTLTILVRTASGLCWAAFTNTRADGFNLDEMVWAMVKAVPAWRA
jgi:CubicO group peptidase (beta-lactamase class C family)